MRLDLRELINIPGKSISFSYDLDLGNMAFPSVKEIKRPLAVEGTVYNEAGVVRLKAEVSCDLICICDRCASEFCKTKQLDVEAVFADEIVNEDNVDIFLLDGNFADIDEVIINAFVLSMESKFLCRDDCKGLCPQCGKNLNEGPCSCKSDVDPRLAVLEQLLDD